MVAAPDRAGTRPRTARRRRLATATALCTLLFVGLVGLAGSASAAPANDARGSALVLSGMAGTDTSTTVYATHSADEPTPSCGGGANRFVWFRQTVATAGDTVDVDTVGSGTDTVLAVFFDTGSGLSEVACNDDAYSTTQSATSFTAAPGTYYYGVATFGTVPDGYVRLTHDFGLQLPSGTTTRTTSAGATTNVADPCYPPPGIPDRWYRFIGTGGIVSIDTFGSSYDTTLTVLRTVSLTQAACNDDVGGTNGVQSQVNFTSLFGQRYYVLVGGYHGATGAQTLHVNGVLSSTGPTAPSAPPVPNAPTGLAATSNADGTIGLTWTGPAGMLGFDLTRGSQEVGATPLGTLDPSARAFTDLTPGTGVLDYWLYAVNSSGRSLAAHVAAVPRAATAVTLAASSNPSLVTDGVTLTAQVTSGDGSPAGSVTFLDGAATLGSTALSAGTASLTTSALSPGKHALTATYTGNGTYATSTSSVLNQQVEFTDVRAGAGFYTDIYWLTDRKITGGFADGSFRPGSSVTRQAFGAYLYRFAHDGTDAGTCAAGTSQYPDVPDGSPFCGDIAWLASTGTTGGFGDGTFRPTNPVTRQAVAAFFYRFNHSGADAGACTPGTSAFSDVPDSSPFCGDIKWLASTSPQAITGGFPDGGFHPSAAATRQAAAAYFHRYDTDFGSPA